MAGSTGADGRLRGVEEDERVREMNRLNWEITKRTYTMDIDSDLSEYTPEERKDWDDMWMLNRIVCAIRYQRNAR